MSPYVRTVKTASGATAVQIVHSNRRGAKDIEHIGSAHDDAELESLKLVARERLAAGQEAFDLGLGGVVPGRPLQIVSSRMGYLWDALVRAYAMLGFEDAAGGDGVFRALVLVTDHRAGLEAGLAAGPGRGGRARAVVLHGQTASPAVRQARVPEGPGGGVRYPGRAGTCDVGALRRQHVVMPTSA